MYVCASQPSLYASIMFFSFLVYNKSIIIIIKSSCWLRFPWLSLAIRLYHPSLTAGSYDYIMCLYRAVVDRFYLLRWCQVVYRRTSLMHSFLLLQQCPACLVRQIWMVLEMGSWWPYSCCFVGSWFEVCSIWLSCAIPVFLYRLSHHHRGASV